VYPDLGIILSLLVGDHHSSEAAMLLRQVPHPLGLSLMHRVQVENGLLRAAFGSDPQRAVLAGDALRLWREYLREQVFAIQAFDLEAAFARTAAWNAASPIQPPRWSLLLHAALAVNAGAAFLSFDPALRKYSADDGLTLLPARL
jgi:hypothetical protein